MLEIFLTALFSLLAAINIIALAIFVFPRKERVPGRFIPPVSIILPARNEAKHIEAAVRSIEESGYPGRKEVIIVDDGSTDSTAAVVRRLARTNRSVRLFTVRHSGKSAAINFGISRAKFGILVYMDADSSFGKGSLEKLVAPLADRNCAISSGIIRARHTRNPLTWLQDIDYIASSSWRYVCSKVNATYIAPGFAAFRKRDVLKIGGFSQDTLTEDIDTALELRKAGYGAAMTGAVMFTSVPARLSQLVRQRVRWGRGSVQVAKKHRSLLFARSSLGIYGFPMHMFWYAFALLYMPFAAYWVISAYAAQAFLPLDTLVFLVKWFTIYGMLDVIYSIATGAYAVTPLLVSIVLSWSVSFAYLLLSMRKFSGFGLRTLAYAVMLPYYWLMFAVQGFSLAYEGLSGAKGRNIWKH